MYSTRYSILKKQTFTLNLLVSVLFDAVYGFSKNGYSVLQLGKAFIQ